MMNAPSLRFHAGPEVPDHPIAPALQSPRDLAPASDFPDARVFLLAENGDALAQAALWWRDTPEYDGSRLGAIGGFDAVDEDSAGALLDGAAARLREQGCRHAVGPMNGNTWRRHRFVVDSDGTCPFLLEPRNPPAHPGWWLTAGFVNLSNYTSSGMALDGRAAVPPPLRERLLRSGVVLRMLDAGRYDDELRSIHAISLRSFADNFLYTPLPEEDFLESYRKVREYVDPELVWLAERGDSTCGFVFAIPDLEAARRGEKPAVIVKTLAVDPDARAAGLGSLLVDEVHRAARAKGYTEAIHALQHESNTSRRITGRHHGHIIRRYSLFSRTL